LAALWASGRPGLELLAVAARNRPVEPIVGKLVAELSAATAKC